ncbi:MAG: YciI family protein [Candidatus Heimdallarchaeota archaeon]|nr:YciI family protein [Candidatus Heimdallarchaeota archaeon]MDH5646783.1 YciI family protein [Candidatus Heimdallarchaeota archaeon]
MKKYFTIIYSKGPNWKEGEGWQNQSLMDHGQYMSVLFNEGKLILGGPFDDNTGGQSVLNVDTLEEAQEILDKDPGVLSGVFNGTIHPWFIAFGKTEN